MVVSPTRELANQIKIEAKTLLNFHKHLEVCSMVGGTDIKKDVREVKRGIDLLIVTPGRLQDHLKNTPGFKEKLKFARVLVLDEADQMLEMGFRKPIE